MSTTTATRSRIIIPVSEELKERVKELALENRIKVAELGRRLFEDYIRAERRRRRDEIMENEIREYRDLIVQAGEDWKVTDLECWPEDD